jgi:hypothetical protein
VATLGVKNTTLAAVDGFGSILLLQRAGEHSRPAGHNTVAIPSPVRFARTASGTQRTTDPSPMALGRPRSLR